MDMRSRWVWWVGVVALGAVVAVWFLSVRRPVAMPTPPAAVAAPAVRTAADVLRYPPGAAQLDMLRTEALPASALPLTDVLSARLVYDEDATARIGVGVAGRIVSIHAEPGDSVQAGQVLAQIDAPDLGTAYADLKKARADEDRKLTAVQRARELVPGDAISAKDFEALVADHAQAHAETTRAEQRLKNLDPRGLAVNGRRLSLISPLAGRLVERTATPALEVAPGMAAPLFTVTDPHHLWVLIDLPERLAGKVRRGSKVEVSSDAYPDEHFTARVAQTGQLVDPNTRRVTVRALLDNPRLELLPEMFVRARLLQGSGSGVRVPNAALVNQGIYNYVFVQSGVGQFVRRKVTLLTQGADSSYVGEGLRGGERVVTTGALLLDAELTARSSVQP